MTTVKKYLILLFISVVSLSSCNDDLLLEEKPKGFLSPENTFVNREGFNSALAELYRKGRGLRTVEMLSGEGDKAITAIYGSGTDLGWYWDKKLNFGDYSLVNSFNALSRDYWVLLYKIIRDSNVIISHLPGAAMPETDKTRIEAEARFFRAYAYRFLVYLYGDVPIIDSELTGPKFDYTRNPVNEVLSFMVGDLVFASQNLPRQNAGDGHLSAAAADHLLSETYISLEKYDLAIEAAGRVIGDPQYKLMTERFGSLKSSPGDVYWDLFRTGNQNRASGNSESILVWQMEFGVPGGNNATYSIERAWGPYLEPLKDSKNAKAIIPADSLGRGIGFVRPSDYLEFEIWKSDFGNDMRNSSFNIQRQFYNNNPASVDFRKVIVAKEAEKARNYFAWIKKASSPNGHAQGYDTGGKLYTDIYAMRLAETYLLRAEAHLRKGSRDLAAADINVVRNRAGAKPVGSGQVDISYLLDERARELVIEEPRRLTLARMGLLYERTKKYNGVSAPTVQPFNNLLPIPQSVIDANDGAPFKQNPGYN